MTTQLIVVALCGVGMIVVTIYGLYVMLVLPEKRVKQWAQKRGLVLLMSDDASLDNPFRQGTSKLQHIFRVRVRRQDGSVRSGYVKCGSVYSGLFSDYTEEFWDDVKSP